MAQKPDAFAHAAQELEEMVKSHEDPKEEPTITEELETAAKGPLVKSEEKEPEPKPAPAPEPEPEPAQAAQEVFAKSLAESQTQEAWNAEPILGDLKKAMGQGIGAIHKSVRLLADQVATLQSDNAELRQMVGTLCKSQVKMHKSLDEMPASRPMAPYFGAPPNRNGKTEEPAERPTRGDIADRIEKAVTDQKLDPRTLGAFAGQPNDTLKMIPEEIRKSYNIPATL